MADICILLLHIIVHVNILASASQDYSLKIIKYTNVLFFGAKLELELTRAPSPLPALHPPLLHSPISTLHPPHHHYTRPIA